MTRKQIISEAISYGIDVEPERCDLFLLRQDVEALRDMQEPYRTAAVERLNNGGPLRLSDEW